MTTSDSGRSGNEETMDTITTTDVLLRVERHDGNDPIEAEVRLPIVPRKGDMLSIWNPDELYGGGEAYVTVEQVVLCSWAPERVEVWLRFDGYDMAEVEQVMAAAKRNAQP